MSYLINLAKLDSELFAAIKKEAQRQEDHIELIASENYCSLEVMEAQGSILTNKYAEGYPAKRYYGGCEYVDLVEDLAIERAKQLFNADFANVQPHSGSQANAAVYLALLNPNDTVLGMDLGHGGHLTHGAKVSFSGKTYNAISYGINLETGLIDYQQVADLARKHRPKMIIAGYSSYSQAVDYAFFRQIADEVGAYLMIDMAHFAGLVAAKLLPNPIDYADVVTSTTHKTLRGPRGGLILLKNHSKNSQLDLPKKLNSAIFPGIQGGPLMHVIAGKAVAFKEALQADFVDYQKQVLSNIQAMAKTFLARGFEIVSGGTTNHLLVLNLVKQNITGKEADELLSKANITVNKNAIPNDPQLPFVTSGIRIGTPAITTRGFKQAECEKIANWIADILQNPTDEMLIDQIKQQAIELCQQFPVYK